MGAAHIFHGDEGVTVILYKSQQILMVYSGSFSGTSVRSQYSQIRIRIKCKAGSGSLCTLMSKVGSLEAQNEGVEALNGAVEGL
jgi:hypothetical protein